jgi:hypothetical protein
MDAHWFQAMEKRGYSPRFSDGIYADGIYADGLDAALYGRK